MVSETTHVQEKGGEQMTLLGDISLVTTKKRRHSSSFEGLLTSLLQGKKTTVAGIPQNEQRADMSVFSRGMEKEDTALSPGPLVLKKEKNTPHHADGVSGTLQGLSRKEKKQSQEKEIQSLSSNIPLRLMPAVSRQFLGIEKTEAAENMVPERRRTKNTAGAGKTSSVFPLVPEKLFVSTEEKGPFPGGMKVLARTKGNKGAGEEDSPSERRFSEHLTQSSAEKKPNTIQIFDMRRGKPSFARDMVTEQPSELGTGEKQQNPASNNGERPIIVSQMGASERMAGEREVSKSGHVSSFQSVLSQEMQQQLVSEMVHQASFVMKDGGEALIRLALKPESLGTVKIRLEMTENHITGRILVDTPEALRAFEQEMAQLEHAFKEGGFAQAHLELSLSSGGFGNSSGGNLLAGDSPFYSERLVAGQYTSHQETEKFPLGMVASEGGINLLA
ncbi:MAG: flagellar hook-length control protein FliK [Treponemataceae bacterium]|nr:flagellar hook-length control protein FliK [Treponemataceae bacterium]